MAVTSMQAVNVIGLMEHIDEVIQVLGESGVFQPDEVSNFYSDIGDFTHLQTKDIYAEPLTNLKSALNQTKRKIPIIDATDFSPSVEELESFSAATTAEIDALVDKREVIAARLEEAKHDLSVTEHFLGLGVEIEKVLKMRYMKARFGRLPKDSIPKLEAYKNNDYVDFAVCTEDKLYSWGVYFAPKDKVKEIDSIFEGLFFEPATDLVEDNRIPREKIAELKEEIPRLEKELKKAQKDIDRYIDDNMEQISRYLSKLEELYLYAGIRNKALQHNKSFIIVGWAPTENKRALKRRLKKIKSVELDFSPAKDELDKHPPVKLKNSFLAKPFEYYTEMYGVPRYNEIDPTLFIAITYILIFGIMFADLGQGFCIAVVGILMWKIKKMPIGKILFPCGLSAMVFGTIFGSVFGDEHALDGFFEFLGFTDGKPMQVMEPENTNSVILTAISIGVILLIIAMCLNVYSSLRQKNPGEALFGTSGVAGIVFYGASVLAIVSESTNLHIVNIFYILGLIVLPFLLIFFREPLGNLVNREKDWQPESWGGYIVENFFESIEVLLGYVTNTMSFLRIGVFVLVHAGMMLVVYTLANATGEHSIPYWIILVFGNILVMALEALLVSIQVLRLEYYEMFNHFYSGEGRPFSPVKLTTE